MPDSENVKKSIKEYLAAAKQLLFPHIYCPVCGAKLDDTLICPECTDKLKNHYRRCECCGSFLHPTSLYCDVCTPIKKRYFIRNISGFPYENEYRHSIVRLKFHGKKYLRHAISYILIERYLTEYAEIKFDLAIPVPTPPDRLKERGYNQVDLYAKPTAKALHIPYSNTALYTVRENPSFVGKKRNERIELAAGTYKADPDKVRGKTVLLFDDVFTTGATMNACSKALIKAGAAAVYGMTAAGHFTKN